MTDRSVLIIEDDLQIQRLLRHALEDEGYEVRVALHGQEALDLLDGWLPGIILLDLLMPVMDGRAFRAAQIRLERGVDIPFIVLSASRDGSGTAEELGAAAYVAKPFELDDLIEVVDQCAAP